MTALTALLKEPEWLRMNGSNVAAILTFFWGRVK